MYHEKGFLGLWMMLFASLVIVSCSDDDASSDDMSIVGKWQLVSVSPASMQMIMTNVNLKDILSLHQMVGIMTIGLVV